MTLMSIAEHYAPMRPNVVDERRFVRASVVTALELRLFHQADDKGIVRFQYMALDNVTYQTAVKTTPNGDYLCPACGLPFDALYHHPGDRGLCCDGCLKRLAVTVKAQARRPAKRRVVRRKQAA